MGSEKEATCRNEYVAHIRAAGGLEALTVLSSYTFVDESGHCPFGPGRHIYTEWGTKDGRFVAEVEEHNGEFTYRVPRRQNAGAAPSEGNDG